MADEQHPFPPPHHLERLLEQIAADVHAGLIVLGEIKDAIVPRPVASFRVQVDTPIKQ